MQEFFQNKLQELESQSLRRFLKTVSSQQGAEITFEGRSYLNFSSNNYLGLANNPLLRQAAIMAVQKYGTGSGASRLITGSMSLHQQLEKRLSQFKGTEAALLFNSGYQANIGIISSIVGEGDLIFSDELNHASLIDGCRLSRAETKVYRHNDVEHLEELLQTPPLNHKRGPGGVTQMHNPSQLPHSVRGGAYQKLIITDSLFSMDGDIAPLNQIMALAEKYDALVLVDEAHATGVFGSKGRGLIEHCGIPSDHPRLIQMGTLGKALGSFGAYVCGPQTLIDWLVNKARSFIYTTSLPPAVVAASLAAVDFIMSQETIGQDWRVLRTQLMSHVANLKSQLVSLCQRKKMSLVGGDSPIFALILGDEERTMRASNALFEKGLWIGGIRPPTVPKGTSRLRLTLMATHTQEHLSQLITSLEEVL